MTERSANARTSRVADVLRQGILVALASGAIAGNAPAPGGECPAHPLRAGIHTLATLHGRILRDEIPLPAERRGSARVPAAFVHAFPPATHALYPAGPHCVLVVARAQHGDTLARLAPGRLCRATGVLERLSAPAGETTEQAGAHGRFYVEPAVFAPVYQIDPPRPAGRLEADRYAAVAARAVATGTGARAGEAVCVEIRYKDAVQLPAADRTAMGLDDAWRRVRHTTTEDGRPLILVHKRTRLLGLRPAELQPGDTLLVYGTVVQALAEGGSAGAVRAEGVRPAGSPLPTEETPAADETRRARKDAGDYKCVHKKLLRTVISIYRGRRVELPFVYRGRTEPDGAVLRRYPWAKAEQCIELINEENYLDAEAETGDRLAGLHVVLPEADAADRALLEQCERGDTLLLRCLVDKAEREERYFLRVEDLQRPPPRGGTP